MLHAQAAALPAVPRLLRWRPLLAFFLLVLLFVPIRRFALPGRGFDLEPYRVLAAFLLGGWLAALLVDPRVSLRRTGFEAPFAAAVAAAVASLLSDRARLEASQADVLKKLVLFAGFLLTLYLIAGVVRTLEDAEFLCRLLVTGGAVVAVFAVVESRTGFNVFDHVLPLPVDRADVAFRSDVERAYGPAQHPIALGALLVMLSPLAVHFARSTGRLRWWGAVALLVLGTLATVSRTGLVMLAVVLAVALWLRPRTTLRLLPVGLALVLAVLLAQPKAAATLVDSFSPANGLVAEQAALAGTRSSGRIADLAPALHEFARRPLLGEGFGTRNVNAPGGGDLLLDNQWLVVLLETGLVGALALLWLFVSFVRRAGKAAKRDVTARGSLLAALAAAVAAYAVSMLTYDASAFIQVTYVLFVLLGLGASVLRLEAP